MDYVEWYVQPFTEGFCKVLISVTLIAPQVKVAMGSLYPIA